MRQILFGILIVLFNFGCTKKGKDKIFLLPNNFVGYAIIIYNQPDGREGKVLDNLNTIIFEIPSTRILKTQINADYGRTSLPEFYYDAIIDKNRIPLIIDAVNYSEKNVNATMPNIGKVYKNGKSSDFVEYSIFYIGTKDEIEKASLEVKRIDLQKLIK